MPTKALDDLTRDDARKLSSVLHAGVPLTPDGVKRLNSHIALLPAYLRRSRFLSIMVDKLGLLSESTSLTSPCACAFHKSPNRTLVSAILKLFRAEVSCNLDSLAASQSKLSPIQRGMIQNLRTVNGLWLLEGTFERRYLLSAREKWHYQRDRCEACMLGRISRDGEVLTQMRTVLLSRLNPRKTVQPPRLLRWVDEFIKCHESTSLEMFMRSGEESVALRGVRNCIKSALRMGYNPSIAGLRVGFREGTGGYYGSGGHVASWHGKAQQGPLMNDIDSRGGVVSWPGGERPQQKDDEGENEDRKSDYKLQIINAYANENALENDIHDSCRDFSYGGVNQQQSKELELEFESNVSEPSRSRY